MGCVGGGGDDAAASGVSMAADDHWLPGQLRAAQHLHSRDELVQVDLEDPVHARQSRCTDDGSTRCNARWDVDAPDGWMPNRSAV
jgi:hypothetical protein